MNEPVVLFQSVMFVAKTTERQKGGKPMAFPALTCA